MDTARHVFDTFFSDTPNPFVRHHLDSFKDFLSIKLPNFIKGKNPLKLTLPENRSISVFIGGKTSDQIRYLPPTDEFDNMIFPHQCRLDNKTYALQVRADVDVVYTIENEVVNKRFEDVFIAKIPLMLKSHLCYLSAVESDDLYDKGECRFELGGYFVVGGSEKVLLTQEMLGNNMFYASKRRIIKEQEPSRSLIEKEIASQLEGSAGEDFEYFSGIRSQSEDGTKGPYSHFLLIPPMNVKPNDPAEIKNTYDYSIFSTKRMATITLPGFTQPVPLLSVFYALGITTHQDIYDITLFGIPTKERDAYTELFMELVLSHEVYVRQEMAKETEQDQDPNFLFLRRQTRTRSNGGIFVALYDMLFPHCEVHEGETNASFYRRKAYLLGHMLRIAMDVALKISESSDRDHFRYKRLLAGGDLCFDEFSRIYKQVSNDMLTGLDRRIEYERNIYAGKNVVELIQPENFNKYWIARTFLQEFEKSFKGKWGGKDGISQELSRFSYLGTIAHMRRVNLQMDKGTKIVEPRRIHSSGWGLMCPSDNPDGHNIGMIKSLTTLCSLSTAVSSSTILDILTTLPEFTSIADIHPSTWNPIWTKVFINSDIVGAFESGTEEIHTKLLKLRRTQKIQKFVSLCWSRMANEYLIFTDSGRPSRPIYREGVTQPSIKSTKSWEDMLTKHMDFIDAQETECLRISMEPFSSKFHSEIHGIAIFSPSASVLPYSDFNQAPRNMFSCQQVKQACSWYNTAFNKRFDTISTWLNYGQRPITQTWMYNPVLGGSGCMPYGENAIVALCIYSGYNQEDSILLNEASLRRGMFHTSYYHSYDIQENHTGPSFATGDIEPTDLPHTHIVNMVTNSEFRDKVVLDPKYDYSMLDADGVIKEGSKISDNTILVGIVTPLRSSSGEIIGYKDSSSKPKRSQHGIIDCVYRYVTEQGLRGVKIRIVESRIPVFGDKFSARHGQKGTCGMIVPEENMPYTKDGIRPDMVVNPHAFPSRMTIGMFIEMMSTKLGLDMGCTIDATPFTTQNRVGEMRQLLVKAGFHQYGHEILYNGETGQMMSSEVFMAPTYYIRSKLMVDDKINYRSTGPKKLLTHQPLEGRASEGGLRIGEMERDGLLSHGMSKFINESLMERSDKSTFLFQPETGLLDADEDTETTQVNVPYALRLFLQELQSMHISVKLASN
jgi:DNA-directed RNA polymerase II subunit RPB2